MHILHIVCHIHFLYIESGNKELIRIQQAIVNAMKAMDLAIVGYTYFAVCVDTDGGRWNVLWWISQHLHHYCHVRPTYRISDLELCK